MWDKMNSLRIWHETTEERQSQTDKMLCGLREDHDCRWREQEETNSAYLDRILQIEKMLQFTELMEERDEVN